MNNARDYHTSTILTDGKVLVTGGDRGSTSLNTTELYDPPTDTSTTIDNMNNILVKEMESILVNEKVLVSDEDNAVVLKL